jgi:glycosyltransferase involved in cell wall biosynthesis
MPNLDLFKHPTESWHPEIEGWSTDILPFYERIVKDIPDGSVIIEIGVHHGRSALFLAELLYNQGKKDCKIFCIDKWENKNNFNTFLFNRDKFNYYIRSVMIEIIQSDSCNEDTINLIHTYCKENDKAINLVFIDGDHSYPQVKKDIDTWLKFATEINGPNPFILAGHDYWEWGEHAGVGHAVNELGHSQPNNKIYTQGSCWYSYYNTHISTNISNHNQFELIPNVPYTSGIHYSPLVSVIILCHNQIEFLSECLESLKKQTYKNIEIIIGLGDNNKTLSESKIKLSDLRVSDHTVTIFEKLNKGIGHALNTCIDQCNSDLIIRMDADDKLTPTTIEQYIKAYSYFRYPNYPFAIVTSNYFDFKDSDNSQSYRITPPYFARNITDSNHFHTSSMFTKELWKAVGGFNEALTAFEDWEFWIRCCTKNPLVIKINDALLHHRIHPKQATTEDIPNSKIWEACIEISNPDIYPESLEAKHFLNLISRLKSAKPKDLKRIQNHITWYPESTLAKRIKDYFPIDNLKTLQFNLQSDTGLCYYCKRPKSEHRIEPKLLPEYIGDYYFFCRQSLGYVGQTEFSTVDNMKTIFKAKPMSTYDNDIPIPKNKPLTKICLTMIVKNEINTIERVINSVKDIIWCYSIVDTGSTDNTPHKIKEIMDELMIPGIIHHQPWVNFAHNRNQAIELAKEKYFTYANEDHTLSNYYLLIIDADDTLEIELSHEWPSTAPAYSILTKHGNSGLAYRKIHFLRTDSDFKYYGPTHEVLLSSTNSKIEPLNGIYYRCNNDGARSHDPNKFLKDARLLEEYIEENPNDGRWVFYLAQSYRDHARCFPFKTEDTRHQFERLAYEYYSRRIDMGGFEEEVFCSMLERAKMAIHFQPKDLASNIFLFMQAWQRRPNRAEPLVELCIYLRNSDAIKMAYPFAKIACELPIPTNEQLFVNTQDYDWRRYDEFAIAAYWIGNYELGAMFCRKLLAENKFPSNQLDRIKDNLRHNELKIKEKQDAIKQQRKENTQSISG